ncbi:MAG: InlB B-repeat-containing protein, partial [Lachnospiraceae bacterium]|nr:InlB B-repeat-containing protein [Lachnospiraceae bacterium]
PMEYSMGTLAGDLFSGQYIHHRTFEWREGVTLEEYLTRQNSVYIPMVIKDETYTHSNVLVLYGDGGSRQMYEEIEGNHETFISKAFSAKDYRPDTISVDRISYTELTAYSMLEQYDFIFIENDTYDYFSEVQYSILEAASYLDKYITYAVDLEELEYLDKEQPLVYDTVSQISLPDSLETDSASWLIKNQGRVFPNLQSADGTGTKYKKDAQDVLYAEDDESLCCIGVTTNNKNTEYHLKAEKEMHILPDAFGNIGRADIYLHAPVLYLWADCFHDYSLGTDSEPTMQEIYAEYDPAVYESYGYIGDDAEFPTAGTEEETYRYEAEYVLREKPDSELSATVNAVQSVPLSGTPLSKQPNYYLNKNNTGAIYLYDIYGNKVRSNTLNETIFSPTDEKNADNLLKQLLKLDASEKKVFITATDSTIDQNKSNKLGYKILRSGLSSGELKRALTVINCKYFQYLYLTQSYKREYIDTESGLEVFHKQDSRGNWEMCNIDFDLKVSDWEITDESKVFTGWVYGIKYKRFKEYYDICIASDEAINRIINIYSMKDAKTAEDLIDKINRYVRNAMAYDNYMEINDISWALKDTSKERNPSRNNVTKHGMCASYSRLAFAIGAKFGYEIIPCKTWKNKREKALGKGAVHSVSKIVRSGKTQYCDFCWSSPAKEENTYIYMDNAEMEKYESHYGPEADKMGTVISLKGKEIKDDKLNVFTVTFDGNGGTVKDNSKTTNHEAKLASLPSAVRRDYLFEGWYTQKTLGKKITLKTVYEKDTRVYAHWKKAAPAKAKVKSGKQKNTSLVITYQKIKEVEGYQLQYSTAVSFTARSTNVINNKNGNSTVITIPGLKENYMYYVRVRAFRKDSMGRTVYGPWSAVKKYKMKSSVK